MMNVTENSSYSPEFCLIVVLAEIFSRILKAISSVFEAMAESKKTAQDPSSLKSRVKAMESSLGKSNDLVKQMKACLKAMAQDGAQVVQLERKCEATLSQGKLQLNAKNTVKLCKKAIEKAKGCQFLIKRIILSIGIKSHQRSFRRLLEELPSEISEAAHSIALFCRRLPTDLKNKEEMRLCMSTGEKIDRLPLTIQFYQKLLVI